MPHLFFKFHSPDCCFYIGPLCPQVIAIVMDVFTDVDMFADILNAAMRNVAVYILLDKHNVHHFVNMVSNCRVDLQSIQVSTCYTEVHVMIQCSKAVL